MPCSVTVCPVAHPGRLFREASGVVSEEWPQPNVMRSKAAETRTSSMALATQASGQSRSKCVVSRVAVILIARDQVLLASPRGGSARLEHAMRFGDRHGILRDPFGHR